MQTLTSKGGKNWCFLDNRKKHSSMKPRGENDRNTFYHDIQQKYKSSAIAYTTRKGEATLPGSHK